MPFQPGLEKQLLELVPLLYFRNLQAGYLDLPIGVPGNPNPGSFRVFGNSGTGMISAIDSFGNPVFPPATSIALGTLIDGGTY